MTILGQIGNTPLLKLNRVTDSPDVEIYVKCEFMNPGGSIKDRMALRMIQEAEKSGKLTPGGTIIEQSTGNTGPALAFVGAVKGYDVQLFLPSQLSSSYNPADRIRIAKLFGCQVVPVDLGDYIDNLYELSDVERAAAFVAIRMAKCYELGEFDPSVWWSNQLCNTDNTNKLTCVGYGEVSLRCHLPL
jgi:cysteine synthase